MDTYRGASMRWPTRDGVIPFRLFFALEAAIGTIAAAEQLQAYYATLLGVAQVMGRSEGASSRTDAVRALTALAHPEQRAADE